METDVRNLLILVGIAIVVLIIVGIAFGGSGSGNDGTGTTESQSTESGTNHVSTKDSTSTYVEGDNEKYPAVICSFLDYKGTYKVELVLVRVIRGEYANSLVQSANMFNKKPPEGYEYALLGVGVVLLDGERFSVNPLSDFKVESKGRLTGPELIVLPEKMPQLEPADLLPGGVTAGWLAFIVPKGSPAWLHLEPLMTKSAYTCKISLSP